MIRRRRKFSFFLLICLIFGFLFSFVSDRSIKKEFLSIFDEIHRDDLLYLKPSRCFSTNDKKEVRRAILIHFPVDRASIYLPELKWLFLSWIEIVRNQAEDWQTDLIIYSLSSSIIDQFNCRPIEQRSRSNDCYRIDYSSLWSRNSSSDDHHFIRSIQTNIPSWCQHLDSLAILIERPDILDYYHYILRTDIDVFLTPRFANYIPFDCSFQIGLGGYSLDYTVNRLFRISKTIHLYNANMTNVGSTWYGPPKQMVQAARLALWLSVWLGQNEFTLVEKNQRFSILSWPQWYIGVISMYSGQLALNHLAARGQINLIQKPYLLDYSCTNNQSLQSTETIHIHAWHTNLIFSKFHFKDGSYDSFLHNRTDWNSNFTLDFILRLAWKSKMMDLRSLANLKNQRKIP